MAKRPNSNALLPDYRNAGAPGKPRTLAGSQKSGAKRKFGNGTGIKITPEIERLFRLVVESELLNDKKINITSAHRQFEELFVQHYPHIKQEIFRHVDSLTISTNVNTNFHRE